jgi:hypothetical protein
VAGAVLLVAGVDAAPVELQLATVSIAAMVRRGMMDLQGIRGSDSSVGGDTVARGGFRSTSNRAGCTSGRLQPPLASSS